MVRYFYICYSAGQRNGSLAKWLSLSLLGGIMALAPMGVHLATRTHLFTDHVSERFILNHWARFGGHGTDSFIGVVLGQIKINLGFHIRGCQHILPPFQCFPAARLLAILGLCCAHQIAG